MSAGRAFASGGAAAIAGTHRLDWLELGASIGVLLGVVVALALLEILTRRRR
jgi:hypothetical protein